MEQTWVKRCTHCQCCRAVIELGRLSVGHLAKRPPMMNLNATLSPWNEDRGRSKTFGLAGEVKRPAWCRCGDEENRNEGRRSAMPKAMPGMSGMKNKKEAMGRLAWSKVPVTIMGLGTEHANQACDALSDNELDGHGEVVPCCAVGVEKHTWSDRSSTCEIDEAPPLLDDIFNGHVYTSGRMGSNQSKTRSLPKTNAPRGAKRTQPPNQPPSLAPSPNSSLAPNPSLPPSPSLTPNPSLAPSRRIPNLQFRVLIIGRANAGKTSILQRVCDTTESPTIYRGGEEVSCLNFCP